jgi:hypothetical protein
MTRDALEHSQVKTTALSAFFSLSIDNWVSNVIICRQQRLFCYSMRRYLTGSDRLQFFLRIENLLFDSFNDH